jgi:hypothetical protein
MIINPKITHTNPKSVVIGTPFIDLANQEMSRHITTNGTLDAIILPAGRPAEAVAKAAQLASITNTLLIVLCSRHASIDDVARKLSGYQKLSWYAIDIADDYSHPLLHLSAGAMTPRDSRPTSDVGKKRNIGMILGKGIGGRLLFLDDDIELQAPGLHASSRMLEKYPVVGFRIHPDSFPDVSVGMHATRILSQLQLLDAHNLTPPVGQYYLNGGSLAINLHNFTSHFPENIYDEDWLFLYEATARNQTAIIHETWKQAAFDPFISPQRAGQEEFGNIISKGLYNHLRLPATTYLTDERYWRGVIKARRQRLEILHKAAQTHQTSNLFSNKASTQQLYKIREALVSALAVNRSISARQCVAYYRAWHETDVPNWNKRFANLPTNLGIDYMLELLGLTSYTSSLEQGKRARYRPTDKK